MGNAAEGRGKAGKESVISWCRIPAEEAELRACKVVITRCKNFPVLCFSGNYLIH